MRNTLFINILRAILWRCRDSNPGPDKATESFLHAYLLIKFSKSDRFRSLRRHHLIFLISDCDRSISRTQPAVLLKCGYQSIGRRPGGTKSFVILDYAANAKLLSPFVVDHHLLRSEQSCSGMLTNRYSFLSIPVIPILSFTLSAFCIGKSLY